MTSFLARQLHTSVSTISRIESHFISSLKIVEREVLSILDIGHCPENSADEILLGEINQAIIEDICFVTYGLDVSSRVVLGGWSPTRDFAFDGCSDECFRIALDVILHAYESGSYAIPNGNELTEIGVILFCS